MSLQLASYRVERLRLGDATRLDGRTLTVDAAGLAARLDPGTGIDVVHPGEPARVVHVLDAVEPRWKPHGPSQVFPGTASPLAAVGRGRTNRLAGVAVLVTGRIRGLPEASVLAPKEAIVDMSGPLADCSPFASTANLVLSLGEVDDPAAVRRAGLAAAGFLAEAAATGEPDELEVWEEQRGDLGLVLQVTSHEHPAYDTLLYGRSVAGILPLPLLPGELADGALVSANFRYACQRNPTYLYQNCPALRALLRGGRLAGVILTRGHHYELADKQRSTLLAGRLARQLGWRGALVSPEASGHAQVEAMLTVHALEQEGVRAALLLGETAGDAGEDAGLIHSVREADLIVSCGNRDEAVEFPAMARVLPEEPGLRGPFVRQLLDLYCATNQMGVGRLCASSTI